MSLVLLVEDDHDLRSLLVQSLPYFGQFEVIGVESGVEGLEQSLKLLPDCIIIDVKIPGIDGYQLVQALRGDKTSAAIPLIILTALAEDQARFVGLASGADRFLQKPVKPQALTEVIQEVLQIDNQLRIIQYNDLALKQGSAHE